MEASVISVPYGSDQRNGEKCKAVPFVQSLRQSIGEQECVAKSSLDGERMSVEPIKHSPLLSLSELQLLNMFNFRDGRLILKTPSSQSAWVSFQNGNSSVSRLSGETGWKGLELARPAGLTMVRVTNGMGPSAGWSSGIEPSRSC